LATNMSKTDKSMRQINTKTDDVKTENYYLIVLCCTAGRQLHGFITLSAEKGWTHTNMTMTGEKRDLCCCDCYL